MLLAEKREYMENYSPRFDQYENTNKEQKVQPVAKPKIWARIIPIVMIMTGFCMASLLVGRYALISQNHKNILLLSNSLKNEYKIQNDLKLELIHKSSLNNIEEMARTNLNMNHPNGGQVLFIELPTQIKQTDDIEIIDNVPRKTESLWSRIMQLLD